MLEDLCFNRNRYALLGLRMPDVDLTEMPAVMDDALHQAVAEDDDTVIWRKSSCPLSPETA